MVDQATAKYLNDNIGAVLSKALSEMSVQQPNDGVDFLSQWLKNYAEQEDINVIRIQEENQMQQDRAVIQKKEAEKSARVAVKVSQKQSIEDSFKTLLEKFNDPAQQFQESYWDELVGVSKQYMGAQSVYLGILDEEGLQDVEPPLIRYTTENIFAGSPTLLDKVLPKMKDAETSTLTYNALAEAVPEEEQAAKFLWKPPLPPQDPVPEGEEAPPPPEGPKYLSVAIPCVTDTPITHYFEMPRLGAYLATPLVYPSYYTQEAFAEALKFEEEKAELLRIKTEKLAEREAQVREAEEKGLEAPVFDEEEEVPEPVMALPGVDAKMVLCMDTLGTNTLFDEAKYKDIMDLCDACAACKARTEIKEVDEQALFAIGVERRAAADEPETGLPNLRADAEVALQQPKDDAMADIAGMGLEAEAKAAAEEVCAKKFLHLQAKMLVDYYKEPIKTFLNQSFTTTPEMLNVIAGIAFIVGHSRAEVYPDRKAMLKWASIKKLFADGKDDFFVRIDAANLDVGRKNLTEEQKLAFIKTLMPADVPAFVEGETAKKIDPAFDVLFNFLNTAIEYRSAALKQMRADYNNRKKNAEEADPPEPFEEPELSTIDDDFEGLE